MKYYLGTPTNGQLTETKSGQAQVAITFNITHQQQGDEWAPLPEPKERTVFMMGEGNGFDKYTKYRLEDIGFDGSSVDDDPWRFSVDQVMLEEYEDTYGGKTKTKWRIYSQGGGSMDLKPAAPDKKARFKSLLGASPKAVAAPPPTGAPAAPAAATPPAPAPSPATSPASAPTATAASVPSPSAPPATAIDEAPKTRDEAWALYCKHCEEAGESVHLPSWQAAEAKHGDNWPEVISAAITPF